MMNTIIINTQQLPITATMNNTKTTTPHNHSTKPKPLNLQTQSLCQIIILQTNLK